MRYLVFLILSIHIIFMLIPLMSYADDADYLYDCLVVKFDSDGDVVWASRKVAGCENVYSLKVDDQGNVYLISDWDIAKYNEDGSLAWNIDGKPWRYDIQFSDLDIDDHGNVYISGNMNPHMEVEYAISKISSNGNISWTKYFDDGRRFAKSSKLVIDKEGNVIVTGLVYDHSEDLSSDDIGFATVKYNPDGKKMWSSTYICEGSCDKGPVVIMVDSNDYIYIAGEIGGNIVLIKYNDIGTLLWTAEYNLMKDDTVTALSIDSSDNPVVVGKACDFTSDNYKQCRLITIKYSDVGEMLWQEEYNGLYFEAMPHVAVYDQDLYVAGFFLIESGSYIKTIKYDANGSEIWAQSKRYGDLDAYVVTDQEGNVIVKDRAKYGFVKYDSDGNMITSGHYFEDISGPYTADILAVDVQSNVYVAGNCRSDYHENNDDKETSSCSCNISESDILLNLLFTTVMLLLGWGSAMFKTQKSG